MYLRVWVTKGRLTITNVIHEHHLYTVRERAKACGARVTRTKIITKESYHAINTFA